MTTPVSPIVAERLDAALWSERILAERARYELAAVALLVEAGEDRFVPGAVLDLELTAPALRQAGLRRRRAVMWTAAWVAAPRVPTSVGELAEAVDDPWRTLLVDHACALGGLRSDLDRAMDPLRPLLRSRAPSALRALRGYVGADPEGGIPSEAGPSAGTAPALAYAAALRAASRALPRSLTR